VVRTVVFIDLAGFTALVDAHGDEAAVELADLLVAVATEHLCEHGTLIKSIGDAVMLGFVSTEAALTTVAGIVSALGERDGLPLPSTGMHHGSVMERDGDLFGRRVNVAARLAGAAGPGEVLCTRPVAQVAADAGIAVTDRGSLRLRNIADPIPCFALGLDGDFSGEVDPVCRMRVRASVHQLTHAGRVWRFCSEDCAALFAARPGDFTKH
jgi:class 3 adenylate cyclase/YHS domain-containing protein